MSDRKIISINPELFSLSSTNTTRKKRNADPNKPIKIKQNTSNKNKTTRGKILKYIREQQENKYKELVEESKKKNTPLITDNHNYSNLDEKKDSDFQDSINYFKNLEEEHKNKINENKTKSGEYNRTVRHQPIISDDDYFKPFVNSVEQPTYTHHISPSYGCLRNGYLPTYRSFIKQNQTQKNNMPYYYHGKLIQNNPISIQHTIPVRPPSILPAVTNPVNPLPAVPVQMNNPNLHSGISNAKENQNPNIERIQKLSEFHQIGQLMEKKKLKHPKKLQYMKQKKTLRRTFYVGKSKVFPKVGVLVSNRTIRKNIMTKKYLLKQETVHNIKRFLIKKGFIKVGSTAPNDVLREMYESVIMTGGEVMNHNPENLLYNYLNAELDKK